MSLEALHLETSPTSPSPPSGPTESPQDPSESRAREWLRLSDVYLAFLQGAPNSAPWTPVSLVVLSTPDLTVVPPRSTWYLMFVPKDKSVQQPHTIDLSTRPWRVCIEERAFGFAFELGDITNDGNALRYLVKAGSKMTFDYIFSYVAYIKGCRIGALPATQ